MCSKVWDPTRRSIPHKTERKLQASATSPEIHTGSHAGSIQSRTRQTNQRRHNSRSARTHRMDQLHHTGNETKWESETVLTQKT